MPLNVNCFDDFDDAVWYGGFKLPTHEGIEDESHSNRGSQDNDYTCIEGHDVVCSKERGTHEHAEKCELNTDPDSAFVVNM